MENYHISNQGPYIGDRIGLIPVCIYVHGILVRYGYAHICAVTHNYADTPGVRKLYLVLTQTRDAQGV